MKASSVPLRPSIQVCFHCSALPGLPDPSYAKDIQLAHCTMDDGLDLPIPSVGHC